MAAHSPRVAAYFDACRASGEAPNEAVVTALADLSRFALAGTSLVRPPLRAHACLNRIAALPNPPAPVVTHRRRRA